MIKIGVVDDEKEYVVSLARYLQKYSSGKWIISGFTSQQDLMNYMDKKMLDIVVGTDQGILANACKGRSEIRLWLRSVACDLEEVEERVYVAYRFQSALEIGKCIERIVGEYEKDVQEKVMWVAIYSPIGRCGKTTLAREIAASGIYGKWIYFGLEDYSSFECSSGDDSYVMDEFLYYWKERKSDKALQIIEQAEGVLETGSSFLDGKLIEAEDIRWMKKLMAKSKYKGIILDIGSGVLQSFQLFQEFHSVIVPYVTEERALVKKHNFEKLLEQHEMGEDMKHYWFVNMDERNQINRLKRMVFGGEEL